MSMRPLSLAAAALLLVAGCHHITDPAPPAEIYLLASVDGRPLPTTRLNDPSSNGATILHEELILDDRGVATRNTTVRGATPTTNVTATVTYEYTRAGDVVTLGRILCGPAALCIQHTPEQGPVTGSVLTLSPVPTLGSLAGSVLVYTRATFID